MPGHNLNIASFQSYWDTQLENSLNFGTDGPGAIVWVAGRDPWNSVDSKLAISAVTNLGMTVADAYAIAKDFAANFMLAKT